MTVERDGEILCKMCGKQLGILMQDMRGDYISANDPHNPFNEEKMCLQCKIKDMADQLNELQAIKHYLETDDTPRAKLYRLEKRVEELERRN